MAHAALWYDASGMSCPYFYPVEPCAGGSGPRDAMLPLGDAWAGECRAVPGESWQPEEAALRPLCNLGYARGQCARFPPDEGPDAVRFAVSRDDGAGLRIYCVVERDHHPFAHGPLEYSLAAGEGGAGLPACPAWQAGRPAPLLARQAQAYVESYLRRKKEASSQ